MSSDLSGRDSPLLHRFKNQLAIIVGFCELLIAEIPETDAHLHDIVEVHKAARAAMALLPELEQMYGE